MEPETRSPVRESPDRSARARPLRVAYLVNQYPRTSVSFIRREILALEAGGVEVMRFSLRPVTEALASQVDRDEAARTRFVLGAGAGAHAFAVAAAALRSPRAFARALALALRLGKRSDRGRLRHIAYLAEACVAAAWIREGKADHVHAHFGTNSAAVAVLIRALGGPPVSFTVHGPEEFDKPEFLGLREKVRHASFVVAVSSFGRAQIWRWARFEDWPKVEVVRCGLGDELLSAPVTTPPRAPRLLCVARLSEQKGHMLLLEAAGRLAAEGIDFELVLAGDGPLRPHVEEAVRRLGLEGRVRLAGWMSDVQVREALAQARALVLPSFAEGLPVVVMEALALGRPVITTAIAGTPELVENDVTGWLIPAGSVEPLVKAMRAALAAEPAELEAMGRAGKSLVAERHDASREARRLAALFGATASRGAGVTGRRPG